MKLVSFIFVLALGLSACKTNLTNVNTNLSTPLKYGELPAEYFSKLPLFENMKWSPDGKTFSYIQNNDGITSLITKDGVLKNIHILLQTDNKDAYIRDYSWVNNDRLLINVVGYDQYRDMKFYVTRLVAINKDGTQKNDDLIPFSKSDNFSQFQDNFTLIANDPSHVYLEIDKIHRGAPDVYKININTGNLQRIEANPRWVRKWIFDMQGNVRIAVGIKEGRYTVAHRFNSDDEWKILSENEKFRVLGFDEQPDILYISEPLNDRLAVFKFNLKTNTKSLVLSNDKYDISENLVLSSDRYHVLGINTLRTTGNITYFDNEAENIQKIIDNKLPYTKNIIVSSISNNHLILSSNSDVAPRYYVYEDGKNLVHEVAELYPELKDIVLAKTTKITLSARDGLEMEAYLTQPKTNIGKPSPTIIFPHGGPWSRDYNEFNIWTQFLANRGWNVLQINFRGSSGFGEEFMSQGFKQWGLKMQDDIADATQWSITTTIADKNKVCIVGASYGGYASLMGNINSPDLFQCSISVAPVTDLKQLVDHLNDRRWHDSELLSKFADKRIGDWWYDSNKLKATSPVNLAKKTSKPLLVIHGVEDRNVPISHSRDFISELKDSGFINYDYLELNNTDHHFMYEQDRIKLLALCRIEWVIELHFTAQEVNHIDEVV